jgi:hypothetical protein
MQWHLRHNAGSRDDGARRFPVVLRQTCRESPLDNLFNINHLNGSSSDDALTVTQQSFATVFDMGAGNDVINFGAQANGVTVVNAETVNGSDGNDFNTIGNTSGNTTITGGLGSDTAVAGSTPVNFNFAAAAQSQTGNGDTILNFNADNDTFTFTSLTGPNGFTGPIHFVDTAVFDGLAGHLDVDQLALARLTKDHKEGVAAFRAQAEVSGTVAQQGTPASADCRKPGAITAKQPKLFARRTRTFLRTPGFS